MPDRHLTPRRRPGAGARLGAALLLGAALAGTGPAAPALAQGAGGDAYARIQKLEEDVRRLNGRIERLENALRQASEDAGRRFADVEYRLTELEGGDPSLVGDPIPLGQGGGPAAGGAAVAVSEQAAFDEAMAAFERGDYQAARGKFAAFMAEYGDGPLGGEAQYWLGESLFRSGDARMAAQTFLSNVSGHPQGRRAPASLLKLGQSLDMLGQTDEACLTFKEVARRYPGSDAVETAAQEIRRLSCK